MSAQGVWRQTASVGLKRDKAIPRQDSHQQTLGGTGRDADNPILQLLGAHKGHKLQGSQSHLLLGEVPQDILAPQAAAAVPYVTPLSPGFPVTAEHRDSCAPAPAALVMASMGTSACQLWKVPALLRSCLHTYKEHFFTL